METPYLGLAMLAGVALVVAFVMFRASLGRARDEVRQLNALNDALTRSNERLRADGEHTQAREAEARASAERWADRMRDLELAVLRWGGVRLGGGASDPPDSGAPGGAGQTGAQGPATPPPPPVDWSRPFVGETPRLRFGDTSISPGDNPREIAEALNMSLRLQQNGMRALREGETATEPQQG